MIPILYNSEETKFTTRGIGSLSEAQTCIVQEERNGIYELSMVYPVTGRHYGDIQTRSLILAKPNPVDQPQPFRVYRISKPLNGRVSVYAQHISYDLGGIGLSPFTATSIAEALSALKTSSIGSNPFTFQTDKGTQATMKLLTPSTVRTVMGGIQGSIIDVYGGEWKFDRYTAYLYNQRGNNTGVTLRYGKNLTSLEQEENCASMCTAIYPYWTDGTDVVMLSEKTLPVRGGPFDYSKISPVDLSSRFEEKPTENQLRTAAQAYISRNDLGVPKVSLTVSFESLYKTTLYKEVASLETISLCDTVTVQFEKLGVNAVAKVTAYEYDVLKEKYTELSIGDKRGSLADTVTEQQTQLEESPTRLQVQRAIEEATAWITGSKGGYVCFTRNEDGTPKEILIMDTPSIATATKVWRWNQGGLGYSNKGYNGPYTTAITQNGVIVADFISTGMLTTVLIQSEDGKSKWNLNTGAMELFNTKISTTAQGKTFKNSNYTSADQTRINKIMIKEVSPSLEDYEKLDINGDGYIGPTDQVQIAQILNGTRTVNFTTNWRLSLNPTDGDNLLKIYRVYHDNITGKDTENVVLSAGFANVKTNSLETSNLTVSGNTSLGTLNAGATKVDSLMVNGTAYQPVEQKVIGYVVYCSGSSGNQSGCFIPAGISGSFQCASNDWYCAFTFDGEGEAVKTGGSGNVDRVLSVNNF